MAINTLNTRIQLKYDTYNNWINSNMIPLAGEICIAVIPNGDPENPTRQGEPNTSGLSPYAVGMKVGNGVRDNNGVIHGSTFAQLPWIQAIAGDIYAWAKASTKPEYRGSEILATRKDSADLTDESKWTQPSVESWLQSLTNDINSLSGTAGTVSTQIANALSELDVDNNSASSLTHHILGFGANKTLSTLTEENGYIAATFQDIQIAESQVTNLTEDLATKAPSNSPNLTGTPTAPTAASGTNTTQIATTAFVHNAVAGLTGAMHYRGAVTANPTQTTPTGTYSAGDVVTYSNSEYVYDGTNWRELGSESDYAIKGSISKNDLSSDLQTEISNKVDKEAGKGLSSNDYTTADKNKLTGIEANAEVNVIEEIKVNNTALTVTNKSVNITTSALVENLDSSISADAANNNKYSVLTGITQENGLLSNKTQVQLEKIAKTGSIYDIVEGSNTTSNSQKYLILNCGTAEILVD